MRIDKINLTAVGPFTGTVLDFSAGNFYLIFGDNEAGKSSTMRAIRAFFFDFPHKSSDDFVHEMSTLQVGMTLRDRAGGTYDWVRSKKRKDPLKNSAGESISPEAVSDLTGGVSEAGFTNFFGINHEQLLAGGKDVLEGKGEVGTALYAAGLGGAKLKKVLDGLGEQSAALFKRGGSVPPINQGLKAFDAANRERDEASVKTSEWKQKRQAVQDAEAKQKGAKAALWSATEKMSDKKRLFDALPLLAERAALRAEIEALGPVPTLPADFSAGRVAAAGSLATAVKTSSDAVERLAAATKELETVDVPVDLLGIAEVVERLHRRAEGYVAAREMLPKLRATVEATAAEARESLKRLRPEVPMEAVDSLRLKAVDRENVLQLAGVFVRLDERAKTARRRRDEAAELLAAHPAEVAEGRAVPDARALRLRLEEIQSRDVSEKSLAEVRKELAATERNRRVLGARLGLAGLPAESWDTLVVPNEDSIAASVREFERVAAELDRVSTEAARLAGDGSKIEDQLTSNRRGRPVPTISALAELRDDRDARWEIIRGDPASIGEGAERFAAAVTAADRMADEMRADADRVARQEQLLEQQNQLAESSVRLKSESEKAVRWRDEAERRWKQAWAGTGLDPRSPAEMRTWNAEFRNLCELSQKVATLARTEAGAVKGLADAVEALRAARAAAGAVLEPAASYPYEVAATKELLEDIRVLAQEQKDRNDARRGTERAVQKAEGELADSTAAVAAWQAEWTAATAVLGTLRADAAREVVTQTDRLFETLAAAGQQRGTLAEGERTVAEFEADAAELAARFAVEAVSPERVASELSDRVKAGRAAVVRRDGAIKAAAEHRADIDRAGREEQEARSKLADLCAAAGCADPAELPGVEARVAERSRLLTGLRPVEENLLKLSNGQGLDALAAEARGTGEAQLKLEIAEAEAEVAELSGRSSEASEALGAERERFLKMDGSGRAAEAAGRAQMLAASVAEKSAQYVRLRVAEKLLRKAVEEYRKHHQGSLLKRAGALFSRLSCGSFEGLTVSYEEADDGRLCGVRAGGADGTGVDVSGVDVSDVDVSGMSDGTRDALYLSLRLASLEEYLLKREPFPFLVDDVTINLDDRRCRAMLGVLAELSEKTQVIFFTHHARLVELAGEAVGGRLQVHRLRASERFGSPVAAEVAAT